MITVIVILGIISIIFALVHTNYGHLFCHNCFRFSKEYDRTELDSGNYETYVYKCKRCGDETWVDREYPPLA